jgi:hypothetical protein
VRTTITLDPDAEAVVRQRMRTQEVSFKQAVNSLILEGASTSSGRHPYRQRTVDMGRPTVNLDRSLQLAGQFEDEESWRSPSDA